MEIRIRGLGKKFISEWIFRHLDLDLKAGSYAITGPNGSGKSTLVKLIAGLMPPTEGSVDYLLSGSPIDPESVYRELAFTAPYTELIEEFTLAETFAFHFRFRQMEPALSLQEFCSRLNLKVSDTKQVKHFSSGMKQRLKLGLSFYSKSSLMVLDEPTSNLDAEGIALYKEYFSELPAGRLVLICSNQSWEYDFCHQVVQLPSR